MAQARIETKAAIQEINNLINEFNLLIKATGDVSTISKANFRKVETALEGLRSIAIQSTASFEKMNKAQQLATTLNLRQAASLGVNTKSTHQLTSQIENLLKATNAAAVSAKGLGSESTKNVGIFKTLFGSASSLISAFGVLNGVQLFAAILKNAYELNKKFDSLSFTLKTIVKDSFDVAASQRFILDITESFGVELVATTERWIKFLAAAKQSGVTLKDTEQIFYSVTKAASTLGLTKDDLNSVYLALEQMMSKGKVTTEELRRQLGERLPGAVGIMAAAVGVNVNQLDAMLKKGELLSAEVLPKFARALESAYGIETVENIETIISEQNRLTNAWELFVKSITENKGVVAAALNAIKPGFSNILAVLTPASILEQAEYDQDVIYHKKEFIKEIKKIHKQNLDEQLKLGEKYDEIDKKAKKATIAYNLAVLTSGDEKVIAAAQEKMRKLINIRQSYDEKIDASIKIASINALDNKEKEFKALSQRLVFFKKQKKAMEEWSPNFDAIEKKYGELRSVDELNELIKITRSAKAAKEAILEVHRLNAETSTASKFKKDEDDKGDKPPKPPTFEIKPVNDLSNENKISELKIQKDLNDELLAGDKASYEERQLAAINNFNIQEKLATAKYNEDIEKAQSYHDKMLDDLKDAKNNESILDESQLTEKQFMDDLKNNFDDASAIAKRERDKQILDNKKKYADELVKISKRVLEQDLDIADDFYNKQIIAAKEAYNSSKKTAKDKEDLERAMTKIAIEMANARIAVQIKELEAQKILYKDFPEKAAEIERLINDLKASIQTYDPSKDFKEQAEKLTEVLEFVGEASQAIADLGSAIFDRKIENINAEIEAEKNKYDILIGLAKGNKEEQERLETERDAKLKALEAKRLKEEQRKAKFEKANALVQIALNTAIAISKVLGQTGIFGLSAWIPIAALGAVQAATVLATPIPKYKEGLRNAKSDHLGMINDGGKQEFIERDGNILTTSTKNAIINLKKGDTIHKSYDDLVGDDMFSNISRSILLNGLSTKNNKIETIALEKVFDKNLKNLNNDLKTSIRDGFKNVNIHNHTSYNSDWVRYKNDTL